MDFFPNQGHKDDSLSVGAPQLDPLNITYHLKPCHFVLDHYAANTLGPLIIQGAMHQALLYLLLKEFSSFNLLNIFLLNSILKKLFLQNMYCGCNSAILCSRDSVFETSI